MVKVLKKRLKEFEQHLFHGVEDEDKAEQYIDEALPFIGYVVLYFNSLEASLDSVLCENFTDRTDSPGLIVLNKLGYSMKVDLLKRFCDDFQANTAKKLNGYEQIITNLHECGRLRNMVVHPNWEATDEDGYTFIKLKLSKQGMHQEYTQFTTESLEKVIELLVKTRYDLYEFWDHRNDVLYDRV